MLLRLIKRQPKFADRITDACWKNVVQNKSSGRWSHCRLEKGHKGDCIDADGNKAKNR